MAQPRITKNFVTKLADGFIKDVKRAEQLHDTIAIKGQVWNMTLVKHVPIAVADGRDLTQFIFFEIAAKFEEFSKIMFQSEIRSVLKVTRDQAEFIMGDCDNGLSGKMGWGAPSYLKSRAANILGSSSIFFANIDKLMGSHYQRLIEAHTVRNRLAHSGGSAQVKYVKMLDGYGIPKKTRQGLSVGRLLQDYPVKNPKPRRYFYLYLSAYEEFAQKAKAALP